MYFKWYCPDGTTIDFIEPTYLLTNTWNLGAIDVEHRSTSAPYQQGETLIDSKLQPREITIEFLLQAADRNSLFSLQRAIIGKFNPMLGMGVLSLIDDTATERFISCVGNGAPEFTSGKDRSEVWQKMTLRLKAFNPFWYGVETIAYLRPIVSNFFPFSFPFTLGQYGNYVDIMNNGTVESPVTIRIVGDVTNPVITRQYTDPILGSITESIPMTIVMASDEIFKITTGFGNKTAIYYKTGGATESNAFKYLNSNSVLWTVKPGANRLSMSNASIGANTYFEIKWRDYFLGV
jgi:hypothetical protein